MVWTVMVVVKRWSAMLMDWIDLFKMSGLRITRGEVI